MKKNLLIPKKTLLPLFVLLFGIFVPPTFAAMDDYCVSPPFLAQSISPNILIVLDNSLSMCEQAYPGTYDPSQFSEQAYYGYFDGAKNYKYTSNGRWEITTDVMTTGTPDNPIANGSFLNWATMRRTEISKKLLIGGKADPRSWNGSVTVKIKAQTDCDDHATVFDKNFDTSTGTADFIYPFLGNYNFENNDGKLNITALNAGTQIYTVRPNADLTTPLPTGWSEYPVSGPAIAYTKVDEAWSDGDSTYIQPNNTANPVIMDFAYADAEPAGTISVKVHIRAKKTSTSKTRRIHGLVRVNNTDYIGPYVNLKDTYDTYTWTWPQNPKTGSAWTWDQIKQTATALDRLDGFGVNANDTYSGSPYIRITQAYLTVEVTTPSGGPYNIIVDQGQIKATGLIDELDSEVRFGLAYYNDNNEGGRIASTNSYVGYGVATSMMNDISGMTPKPWTPLGETLYEMTRYFRQDPPYYSLQDQDYSVGAGVMGGPNIFRDPYAYEFTKIDSNLTDMYVPCAKSFILFLTDGESSEDQWMPGNATSSPYAACSETIIKACSGYGGSPNNPNPRFAGTPIGRTYPWPGRGTDYMIDVAYWARTNDMRPGNETDVPTSWRQSLPGMQNIFLYPIFMFGTGSSLLKDAAIYGGFVDYNGNNKPDCNTNPAECYKDSDGDGVVESNGEDLPITYYEGNDGYKLKQNIKQAISDIVKRAASSTAVSVLSSSEGSGANLIQSLFYPKRSFSTSADITWTSDVMNYWYYFDPYFSNSQIREDTVREDTNHTLLDLKTDYITSFYFDSAQQKTLAARCQDTDGDGDCDTNIDIIPIEKTRAIWRAGVNLWWTGTDTLSRNIMTSLNGTDLISFDPTNRDALDNYLGQTAYTAAAEATINYVRGVDYAKLCSLTRIPCFADSDCPGAGDVCVNARTRTATLSICSDSYSPCSTISDCSLGATCDSDTNTWKLGDVVSSTPRIMGPSPLNNYHVPFPLGYGDKTYSAFIKTDEYKNRQRVLVGSNDGMFHSFRLGKVVQSWTGKQWYEPGKLEGATGPGGIGTEAWAFIPKNVLPYLQHLSQPDYCHIYMVDGPVTLTDASINCGNSEYWNCTKETTSYSSSSWRSIAIGSMGIGGATSSTADASCVQTPITVGGAPVGWSSYFALDVTAQDNPDLLWEFSNANLVGLPGNPALGVTNVGPAIVKVGGGKQCTNDNTTCAVDSDCGAGGQCEGTNGRWFAILASGSTGPIATATDDFEGTSNQNLWLFVLDLKTGDLLATIDTGIANAFAGSISSNSIDLEKSNRVAAGNYQDDVVYIGYVKNTTSGGVLRLVINDDIDPANWEASIVIDDIGPVTTSVVNLLDKKTRKLWLYFAEGRFFYKLDDQTTRRRLFGIQEPCYVDNPSTTAIDYDVLKDCTSLPTSIFDLNDQTSLIDSLTTDQTGWYIYMDDASTGIGAERVISNPTPDPLGAIFFLSFAPTTDVCGYGGTTYLWALDYKSGGTVTYTMQGKALVQVSTGEIKELDLSDSGTFTGYGNRRSEGFKGIPPTGQGLMIVTNPSPIKRFIHVQEQ